MGPLTIDRFNSSDIKKIINPDSRISESIEELEKLLIDYEMIDEAKQIRTRNFSIAICYKKEGIEVLSLYPKKSNFSIGLSGYKWDISPFLQLPIEMEFMIENTLSWTIYNLEKVETSMLIAAIKESIKQSSNDLERLMKYILMVIKSYISKATFINQSEEKIIEQVLVNFWKGEMSDLTNLYNHFVQLESNGFKQFVRKWGEKLDYSVEVDSLKLKPSMNLDRSNLNKVILMLQPYLEQSCKKYIHSIKNMWFEYDRLQDAENFHSTVEEIRSTIVLIREYISDSSKLLLEEDLLNPLHNVATGKEKELDTINAVQTIITEQKDDLQTLIVKKTTLGNPTLFLDKSHFQDNREGSFEINDERLNKLVDYLCSANHSKEEMKRLIRIIFEICNNKGFAIRDRVNILFKGKYDDENTLRDFASRYDVKRLFVKSTLENLFDDMIEKLIKNRIINEFVSVVQNKEQKKILFNYNVGIYDII